MHQSIQTWTTVANTLKSSSISTKFTSKAASHLRDCVFGLKGPVSPLRKLQFQYKKNSDFLSIWLPRIFKNL